MECAGWVWSFLGYPHAEQPGGPEDQDQDQDAEDPDVGELRDEITVAKHFDHADAEAADRPRLDIPDPSEDGGGEGEEPGREAQVEAHRVEVQPEDDAAGSGE